MVSRYEEREIEQPEVVTRRILVKITCDWCGEAIRDEKGPTNIALGSGITNDEEFDCEFVTKSGDGMYLTGYGWRIEDLCKPCVGRFKKLLEDQGIKLSDVDY